MLTPDQVRERLRQIEHKDHESSCWSLLTLLSEVLPDLVAPQQVTGVSMREPPKMTIPYTGERESTVYTRWAREINDVTAWIAETVALTTQHQRSESRGRECPDCTPEQPCDRARELSGG